MKSVMVILISELKIQYSLIKIQGEAFRAPFVTGPHP